MYTYYIQDVTMQKVALRALWALIRV